jgi:hypothetical protein
MSCVQNGAFKAYPPTYNPTTYSSSTPIVQATTATAEAALFSSRSPSSSTYSQLLPMHRPLAIRVSRQSEKTPICSPPVIQRPSSHQSDIFLSTPKVPPFKVMQPASPQVALRSLPAVRDTHLETDKPPAYIPPVAYNGKQPLPNGLTVQPFKSGKILLPLAQKNKL